MKLLLCAATEMEIASTIQELKTISNQSIQVLITGIGLTAATYSLTKTVAVDRPDFILQAGIAGCLNAALPLTKVVGVETETIGDEGVKEAGGFQSLFDMNLLQKDAPPFKNGKLWNHTTVLKEVNLPLVNGVTVNQISTSPEHINYYRNGLHVSVETMEGAALHYVALMEGIPFLQLRSLSNYIGERDKTNWMIGTAIDTLNVELQRILSKHFLV